MSEQIDTLTAIQSEGLFVALLAIVDRARAAVDRDALVTALTAHRDSPTSREAMELALGLQEGTLSTLIDPKRSDDDAFSGDGLGGFFMAVIALAGAAVGYVANPNDQDARANRNFHVVAARETYAAPTTAAMRESAQRMVAAAGSIESKVRQVLRTVGLSPAQSASLDAIREVLFWHLAPGNKSNPRAVVNMFASRLSGPQRAMLLKAMTPALTEAKAEQLLSRHASALMQMRARAFAGQVTHSFAEYAKLTAWRLAQRVGVLPADQRRYWQTAGDERVRQSHASVPSMNPKGVLIGQPFATPFGETMVPPLESGCRCKVVLRRPA